LRPPDSADGRCSCELLQDAVEHFRVLGKNGDDDLRPIVTGHGVQRSIGIAAMLDVGQLWMHIIGGIPGTVLGRLPHSGLRSRAQQPYQQQHRGYVLQEWHDIWTNQTGSS
jgi:hypothetical protein